VYTFNKKGYIRPYIRITNEIIDNIKSPSYNMHLYLNIIIKTDLYMCNKNVCFPSSEYKSLPNT